jgi:hypothetical protein
MAETVKRICCFGNGELQLEVLTVAFVGCLKSTHDGHGRYEVLHPVGGCYPSRPTSSIYVQFTADCRGHLHRILTN